MEHKEPVISAVPKSLLPSLEGLLMPMIARSVEHSNGEQTVEGLYQKAIDGDSVILIATLDQDVLGIVLASRVVYQSGKAVLFLDSVAGDDLESWIDPMRDAVKSVARVHQCTAVYGTGRDGWRRLLCDHGFKYVHTTVALELGD